MMIRCVLFLCVLVSASAVGAEQKQATSLSAAANPIRKIVTMLQLMVKKIEAEGEEEKELYEKFMCYCSTSDAQLGKSIEDGNTKIPELESSIKESTEEKAQLEEDLKNHQADRVSANEAMAKATEIREGEAAAYAKESTQDKTNLEALTKAIAAITKGLSGGFLQTSYAVVLKNYVMHKIQIMENDRLDMLAFLQGTENDEGESPGSDEILGILKQLKDEMTKDLADVIKKEEDAVAAYQTLMSSKTTEVETLTAAIEEKLVRVGELGVSIAEMKNDLEDTIEAVAEDTKMHADLKKECAAKTKAYEIKSKERSDELIALTETIKILNDDDALELFKKAGAAGASFLQIQVTEKELKRQALAIIKHQQKGTNKKSVELDFMMLALRGKTAGFEKVIKLMDEMVVMLKKEQVDDDNKKAFCIKEFDLADDKKKEIEREIGKQEKVLEDGAEQIAAVTEDIKVLEDGIKALDKSVAVATFQRKEENKEYESQLAANSAAVQLVEFAKNRMAKFYNPKLYKPPPKRELTEEERITLNMGGTLAPTEAPGGIAGTGIGFVQIASKTEHFQRYKKDSEGGAGVMQMMDMMINDIKKEMTQAKLEEEDAQGDYEKMMSDATDKRNGDTKDLTDKNDAKASMEEELQATKDANAASKTDLKATMDYIQTLHSDCDFLLEYYEERKTARASEIDAIGKAKDVLSGAGFFLLQTGKSVKTVQQHLRAKAQ